jgi:PAS domain S-box-containing protein
MEARPAFCLSHRRRRPPPPPGRPAARVNHGEAFFGYTIAMKTVPPEFRPLAAALGLVVGAGLASAASLVFPDPVPDLTLELLVLALLLPAFALGWRSLRDGRLALDALRRDEACHRATIDAAGEAIVVIDDQATILTFNRAAERMFGYSAAEMIGTSLERLMTEGGRRAHAAYLAHHKVTAMVEAARLRTVHKGVRKRGDTFPFELNMTEWSEGGRRLFTGIMRDMTDHEHAADALRESQARFVGLFESSVQPQLIFALSGGGEFVLESMNEAAESAAGLSRYAVSGQTLEELAGADARELKRALLDCLSSAGPVGNTLRQPGEGMRLPLPTTFTPLRSASGEIRAVLATAEPARRR